MTLGIIERSIHVHLQVRLRSLFAKYIQTKSVLLTLTEMGRKLLEIVSPPWCWTEPSRNYALGLAAI